MRSDILCALLPLGMGPPEVNRVVKIRDVCLFCSRTRAVHLGTRVAFSCGGRLTSSEVSVRVSDTVHRRGGEEPYR